VLDGVFQDLEDGRLEVFVGPSKRSVRQRAVDINLVGALEAVSCSFDGRGEIDRSGGVSSRSSTRSTARVFREAGEFARTISDGLDVLVVRRRCCR